MPFEIKPKAKKPHPSTYSPKYFLHEHLCKMEQSRPYTRVHASDLMRDPEFCAREYALGVQHMRQKPAERVTTAENVTYAYGRYVEKQVREWFAEAGRAIGDWKCGVCNHLHEWTRLPLKCRKCDAPRSCITYEEISFRSKKSGVGARPDLFLDMGKKKLTLIEIKSMDKEKFKGLVAPLAEHRWRTNLYMRNVEESGHPRADEIDLQQAVIIYVTKGGYGFQDPEIRSWKLLDGDFSPFKEFVIDRDDSQTDMLVNRAAQIETWREDGKMPARICPTSAVKRAKYCYNFDQCWGK